MVYDLVVISVLSFVFYACWRLWKYICAIVRLPPGPIGLPFFGVANKLPPNSVREVLQEWKDKYGDIYSFTLPGQNIVVVSSYELIKEVLLTRSNEFAGRPESFRVGAFVDFSPLVGFSSDSPKVRMMKKTLNTSLKMYGERLLTLEDISLEALEDMTEEWKSLKGQPFDPQKSLHDVTGKIITSLAYGKYMTEEECVENLRIQKDFVQVLAPGGSGQTLPQWLWVDPLQQRLGLRFLAEMLEMMPWLRYFGNSTWKLLLECKKSSYSLFNRLLEESKIRFDGKNPQCVMHALFRTQKQLKEENGGRDVLSDADVLNQSRGLIAAGTATTFRAMHAFVAILTNNPELQTRLQAEADGAVGGEAARLADKEKMPLMEATIYELLRYISHVPTLIPHATMDNTALGGYTLPEGTQVWVNAFGLHHDPRYWDEPWTFKPERFLDENGKLVTPGHLNRRRLIPFGAGRRVCVGEVLAKNRMFLMMSGIVQNFTFKPKSEAEKPDHDPRNYLPGLATHPKDFEVCAVPRRL